MKVLRHIIDHLQSSSDDSDDFDEKQIKAIRLMCFENVFFEKVILKMSFLREQFWKGLFFEEAISKMFFSRD